jgi:hypothetical protein
MGPRLETIAAVLACLLIALPIPATTGPPAPGAPPGIGAAARSPAGPTGAVPPRAEARAIGGAAAAPHSPAPGVGGDGGWISRACANVSNAGVQQAYDPAGNDLYEAWSGCGGVGFARSVDGGATFSNATSLPVCGSQPSLAVAPDRTLYVAYVSNCTGGPSPYVVASTDQGSTFSSPVRVLPNGTVGSVSADRIAVTPNGTLELLWVSSSNASLNGSTCPAYVCAGGGDPFAAMFSRSFDAGGAWTAPLSVDHLPSTIDTVAASIVVAPDGRTDLLFETFQRPVHPGPLVDGVLEFTSVPNGSVGFVAPQPLGLSIPTPTGEPDGSMGLDAGGTLYVAFDSNSSGTSAAYLCLSNDSGSEWGDPVLLDRSADASLRSLVSVAGGGVGLAHLSWLSNDGAGGAWQLVGETVWGNGTSLSGPQALGNLTGRPGGIAGDGLSIVALSHGVTAVAGSFNVSDPPPGTGGSLQAFVEFATEPLPDAPSIAHVTSGPGTVFVQWTRAPAGAPITGYSLGWGHDLPVAKLTVGPTTLNATATGIVPSVRYAIAVRSINDAGTSPASVPWVNVTLSAYSVVEGTVLPEDANVSLDDVSVPVVDGAFLVNTTVGAHLLNVTSTGYRTHIVTFLAPWNGTTTLDTVLLRDLGNITGYVTPAGALLTWNGERLPVGAGGLYKVGGLAGTTGTLSGNLTDYHNASVILTIPDDSLLWANLTLPPVYGTLLVSVTPEGAAVTEDGAPVRLNASGGARFTLLPGTYRIEASDTGYTSETENATVVAGTIARLSLHLAIAPPNPTSPPADTGTLALYGGIALVAVLLAVVGLFLWRKRMPPPGPPQRPPGSEELYGDTPELGPGGTRALPEGSGGPSGASDGPSGPIGP